MEVDDDVLLGYQELQRAHHVEEQVVHDVRVVLLCLLRKVAWRKDNDRIQTFSVVS